YIQRTYELDHWEDSVDFLTQLAKRTGKLIKGGEADLGSVAKMGEEDVPVHNSIDPSLPNVEQIFSKIPVVQKFLADDLAQNAALIEEERSKQESNAPEGVLPEEVDEDDINKTDDEDESKKTDAKVRKSKAQLRQEKKAKKDAKAKASTVLSGEKLDWDDVFANVVGETVDAIPGQAAKDAEEDVDSELELSDEEAERKQRIKTRAAAAKRATAASGFEVKDAGKKKAANNKRKHVEETEEVKEVEEESVKPVKEARMTTNKGKVGTHYYETANVKNKNRNKVKPEDPHKLATKLRDQGKKRRQ
ncbi:hypothetical protein BGZ90_001827, partial [Linnemannia elongata]